MNIFDSLFTKVLKPIGHFFVIVFDDGKTLEENIPLYIQATEDGVKDTPTIIADTSALIAAVAGGAPILTALESLGTNPAADIAALEAAFTDFKGYWPTLKAALTTELTTLGADAAQIEAIFAPAPTTPATPVS